MLAFLLPIGLPNRLPTGQETGQRVRYCGFCTLASQGMSLHPFGSLLNLRFGKPSENTGGGHRGINGLAAAEMLFPKVRKSDITPT